MQISQHLIDEFTKMKESLTIFECAIHPHDERNTSKTCYQCKLEAEQKELAEYERVSFIAKQEKANIQQDIIDKDSCFDNYIPTDDDAVDFKRLMVAYKYNQNLVVCGLSGNGKTHMGYALINQALQNDMTAFHVLFYNLNRIYIKNNEQYNYLIRCDFLVIDEYGIQDSDYTSGLLYMVMDERTRRGKWTMLITNLTADEFKTKLSTSLFSRFKKDVLTINTNWEDYRIMKGTKNV